MSKNIYYDYMLGRLRVGPSPSTSGGWDDDYKVDEYADLPTYSDHLGEYWMVENETKDGSWYNPFKTTYLAGIYKAVVGGWQYMGINTDNIPLTYDIRGFNRHDSNSLPDVSYDGTTRTFSCSVKSGQTSFKFYSGGVLYTKTSTQSIVWPDTTDSYYFYFDTSGDLQYVKNDDWTYAIFSTVAICGCCYWDADDSSLTYYAPDELHGIIMDSDTHFRLHMVEGFRYMNHGAKIQGVADASSTFTGFTAGYHMDEDIIHENDACTEERWMWLEGDESAPVWKFSDKDNRVAKWNSTTSKSQYNQNNAGTWQLTDCASDTDFVICMCFKSNGPSDDCYFKCVGQQVYATRGTARDALKNELRAIKLIGLPGPEFEAQYAWIYKKNGTLEDDGSGTTEGCYVDLRGIKIGALD